MSVTTFEAFLGQAIQIPPSGKTAASNTAIACSKCERSVMNATITSRVPLDDRAIVTPSGRSPRVSSKPSGAWRNATRDPSLIPSLAGSGVPE